MPAAKKRPTAKKAPVKPRAKSNVKSSIAKNKAINWGIIAVVAGVLAIVGIFYVLLSQAGTTVNYRLADGSIVPRRFPGDPNPRVTGKAYIGADQLEGTTFKTRFEDPTGKSMPLTRRFYGWGSNAKMEADARADIAANRLPLYSTKTPLWADVAAGKHDAQIDDLLRRLDNVGGPVWLVFHHEPDGGCSNCPGPNKEDDPGGAPAWREMQKKVRARMNAVGTKNIAFMPVLTGGFAETSVSKGLSMDAWWVDGIWDAYFIDFYKDKHDVPMASHPYWAKFVSWIEKKNNGAGLPYGTAEVGNRAAGEKGIGFYKEVPDTNGNGSNYDECEKGLTPAGIPAATVQKSADMLKEFWDWGFVNKKDVIAHAYFDKCVNSTPTPWALGGQQLDLWRDIIKNDPRVQRVRDLGTPTTATVSVTPTPTPTTTVTTTPTPTPTPTSTPSPSPTTSPLNINITSPSAGSTVSGTVNVTAGPDTNVQEVSFRLDGAWQTTDTSAPFAWSWNTATATNGQHTLTIRARRVGDPGTVFTERTITVNVNNATATPTPNPDTVKPSAPSSVKGKVEFDALRFTYFTNLTWSASFDNTGVSRYLISRNGTQIGTSNTTNYKDYSLQPNVAYLYEIYAQDTAGNTSLPGATRLTGRCFLVWCWNE